MKTDSHALEELAGAVAHRAYDYEPWKEAALVVIHDFRERRDAIGVTARSLRKNKATERRFWRLLAEHVEDERLQDRRVAHRLGLK